MHCSISKSPIVKQEKECEEIMRSKGRPYVTGGGRAVAALLLYYYLCNKHSIDVSWGGGEEE